MQRDEPLWRNSSRCCFRRLGAEVAFKVSALAYGELPQKDRQKDRLGSAAVYLNVD